jgi:SnoaL-like domain
MSRENFEVVRAIYRAFAQRDREALVRYLDPSIRVYDRPLHPDASVYEGQEGFLRFSESDWEAFEEVAYEPQDFHAKGPTSSSRSSKGQRHKQRARYRGGHRQGVEAAGGKVRRAAYLHHGRRGPRSHGRRQVTL